MRFQPVTALSLLVLLLIGLISCVAGPRYEATHCSALSGKSGILCQEYQQRKASAQISTEVAELLKGYRSCLQEHTSDATKAKEACGLYTQALQSIQVSSMSGMCM